LSSEKDLPRVQETVLKKRKRNQEARAQQQKLNAIKAKVVYNQWIISKYYYQYIFFAEKIIYHVFKTFMKQTLNFPSSL